MRAQPLLVQGDGDALCLVARVVLPDDGPEHFCGFGEHIPVSVDLVEPHPLVTLRPRYGLRVTAHPAEVKAMPRRRLSGGAPC